MEALTEAQRMEPTSELYGLHKRYTQKLEAARKKHNTEFAEELKVDPQRKQDAFIRRLEEANETDLFFESSSYKDYHGFVRWWSSLSPEEQQSELHNYTKTPEEEAREHAEALQVLLGTYQQQERGIVENH